MDGNNTIRSEVGAGMSISSEDDCQPLPLNFVNFDFVAPQLKLYVTYAYTANHGNDNDFGRRG